jgi:hypothetical protein
LQLFTTCFSQDRLRTGLTIGYNSSTFLGDDKPGKDLNPIPGFYLGGIINYPINKRLSVSSNVALCSRGTKINTINEINEPIIFLYLDMPVMAKMNFKPDNKISPFAELGGAFDINVLAIGISGPYYDIKKADLGLVSGAGFEMSKISIGVRYHYGLTHFDKSDHSTDLRNSTVSFLLGLTFGK